MDSKTRALTTQRAYRARKAQYLSELEERVKRAEEENQRLREDLANARATAADNTSAHVRNTAAAAADLMQNLSTTSASLARFQEVAFPAFPLSAPPTAPPYPTPAHGSWSTSGPSSAPAGPVRAPSASSQFSDRPPHSHSSSSELSTAEYYQSRGSGSVGPNTAGGPLPGPSSVAQTHTSTTRLSIANLVDRPRGSVDPRDALYPYATPPVAGPSGERAEGVGGPSVHRDGFGFADPYGEPPPAVPPRPAPPLLHGHTHRRPSRGESVEFGSESDDLVDDQEDDDDGVMDDDHHGMPRGAGQPRGRYELE